MRARSIVLMTLIAFLMLSTSAACGGLGPDNGNPGAGEDFTRVAPAAVGLDGEALAAAVNFATSRNAASVRVLRHGMLAATSSLDGATAAIPNNIFSSTKGVVSLLTGRALTLGRLSLDDPIGKYIPEADEAHARITVRQLLTQSSGLAFSWASDLNPLLPDTVKQCLVLPFVHEPGTYFEYAQTTVTLLAHTVERAVGMDIQDFAQRELFGPLGIPRNDWHWMRDNAGHTHGYAFLFMPSKHLTRLGQLMLQEGAWCGEQLLSRDYVREAMLPSPTNPGYGFLLWSNRGDSVISPSIPSREEVAHPLVPTAPRDMYAFVGFLDQIIFIIPSWDMVVVRTGVAGNYDILNPQVASTAMGGDWMYEFFLLLGEAVLDEELPEAAPYRSEGPQEPEPLAIVDPRLLLDGMLAGTPSRDPDMMTDLQSLGMSLPRSFFANLVEEMGDGSFQGGLVLIAPPYDLQLTALELTFTLLAL
ncbi:MAG: serine hydrolase domain-containing protein [Candidatus Geothermincolia bacterium]